MPVYVDGMQAAFGRMIMCHLLADTRDELMEMADRIGVDRRWYQSFDKASCPHFDIAKSKRALAIKHGAIEVDRRKLTEITKRIRSASVACVTAGQPHGWEP